MALYTYKARNKEGAIYENSLEAVDKISLYSLIRQEGGVLVSVKEGKKKGAGFSLRLGSSMKMQEKIAFAKNLSSMITAGLSVNRSLAVMSKQSKREGFKKIVDSISEDVSHGSSLSEALGKKPNVFSSLFVSMVKAGEESGSMAESLKVVGSQMEKTHLLAKKVRGAMIYPAVIIVVMIVLSILLLIFMVPTLTSTFAGIGVQLPLSTRIIIFLSDFLVANTLLVIVSIAALVLALIAGFRSKIGKDLLDRVSLSLPAIGSMVREVQTARTARTLSSLLSAGVEIISAIKVTSDVIQNHLYKEALEHAHQSIQKGELLSAVFNNYPKLYPSFISEMAAVGEETGKIGEMLGNVATYYEEQVDQKTKNLSTIIEPVLMILIGAAVGIFAISMLAPTYSLVDYI